MNVRDIANQRLHTQHLAGQPLESADAVVRGLLAVQAQDYPGAAWGIAQRTSGAIKADIDQALAAGRIIRTHLLRPTWHIVDPADLRWLLALTSPRVHAANSSMYRKLELDGPLLTRSTTLLADALRGGTQLTRSELATVLAQAGISSSGLRLGYLLMYAELEAVICSGALRGKQFTYALVDERVSPAPPLPREEALQLLTRRYLAGHGPATVHDFVWWSGLTVADARTSIELAKADLHHQVVDQTTYWFTPPITAVQADSAAVHLLPNYDEYLIAFRDHRASFDPELLQRLGPSHDALQAHIIVVDGHVAGGWRRTLERTRATIHPNLLIALTPAQHDALAAAANRYGDFLALLATLDITPVSLP